MVEVPGAGSRAARPRLRRAWAPAVALAAALLFLARPCCFSPQPWARAPRPGPARLALRAAAEGDVWREAYELELERNNLLRDQLESLQLQKLLEGNEVFLEPEECEIDWERSYEMLAKCNKELEKALKEAGGLQSGDSVAEVAEKKLAYAKEPLQFEVSLPAQGGAKERVELVRFFGEGRESEFYALQARLPLGLNLTKRDEGELQGAFVVEDVLPGGSAASSGLVLKGDVLHALTAVMDGSDLGMKTEDFVSSVVGGLGRYRQAMVDATYIDTLEDLIDQLMSNTMLDSDTELVLVFERDVSASPMPAQPLEPLPRPGGA